MLEFYIGFYIFMSLCSAIALIIIDPSAIKTVKGAALIIILSLFWPASVIVGLLIIIFN